MATTTNTQQLHDEFTTHFKLVCWIIRRRLGMLGRYDDELAQEAIALAWLQFAKCRQRVADPLHAVALVARSGVGRALRGSRFVQRERGYVDAMDVKGRAALDRLAARGEKLRHRADRGFVDPAEIADRPENLPADSLNRDPVEGMIARLPQQLQATARLLSYGCHRKLIAERHGVSASTVTNRVDVIAVFVKAMLDERKVGD